MGNTKKPATTSRRSFFSNLFSSNDVNQPEKVKMLTADGKLVEVNKTAFEEAKKNIKTSNKEILTWMKNPSKDNG